MSINNAIILSYIKYIRLKDWWNYILPPVFGIYFLGLLNNPIVDFYATVIDFLCFFFLTVSVAAFGFLLNEYTDIEDDEKAKKINVLREVKNPKIYFLFFGLILLIIISYATLGWSYPTLMLLLLQLLFFILYSVKPFRLKRYPFVAIILDALYSGTIFYMIAFLLSSETNSKDIVILSIIFIWSFVKGIRNILHHLMMDKLNDERLSYNTLATLNKEQKLYNIATRFLLPTEIILFIILLSLFPFKYYTITIYILYIFYFIFRKEYKVPFLIKRTQKINSNFLTDLNWYYENVFPLSVLLLLSYNNLRCLVLLLLYSLFLYLPKYFMEKQTDNL